MNVGSFKTQPGDQLLLVSHSFMSTLILKHALDTGESMDSLCRTLAKRDPELPFWIGKIDLGEAA
jgi:hypothetical protein